MSAACSNCMFEYLPANVLHSFAWFEMFLQSLTLCFTPCKKTVSGRIRNLCTCTWTLAQASQWNKSNDKSNLKQQHQQPLRCSSLSDLFKPNWRPARHLLYSLYSDSPFCRAPSPVMSNWPVYSSFFQNRWLLESNPYCTSWLSARYYPSSKSGSSKDEKKAPRVYVRRSVLWSSFGRTFFPSVRSFVPSTPFFLSKLSQRWALASNPIWDHDTLFWVCGKLNLGRRIILSPASSILLLLRGVRRLDGCCVVSALFLLLMLGPVGSVGSTIIPFLSRLFGSWTPLRMRPRCHDVPLMGPRMELCSQKARISAGLWADEACGTNEAKGLGPGTLERHGTWKTLENYWQWLAVCWYMLVRPYQLKELQLEIEQQTSMRTQARVLSNERLVELKHLIFKACA